VKPLVNRGFTRHTARNFGLGSRDGHPEPLLPQAQQSRWAVGCGIGIALHGRSVRNRGESA
jgi:hypothetical protein